MSSDRCGPALRKRGTPAAHVLAGSPATGSLTGDPSPARGQQSTLPTRPGHSRLLTRIVQFLLYFSVALGIVLLSGRHYLARDRRMAAFVGVLVVLLAAGHVLRSPRWTYPFERWAMYGNPEAPTGYNEFLIRDDAGPMQLYPFSHVAPIAPRAFMLRVRQMVRICRCSRQDRVVDTLLAALAEIHRERTGRAVTQFDVYDVQRMPGSLEPGPRTLRYRWRPAGTEGS